MSSRDKGERAQGQEQREKGKPEQVEIIEGEPTGAGETGETGDAGGAGDAGNDLQAVDVEGEAGKEQAKEILRQAEPGEDTDELAGAIQALLPIKDNKGKPASQRTLSTVKKHRFLRHYILSYGRVTEACKLSGVPYTTFWAWTRKDPAFVEAYETAQTAVIPLMEDSVRQWGFQGIDKPIIHKGEVTGHVKEKNALIAMFALKKMDPAYRDNAQAIGIKAGGDVEISFAEPEK